MLRRPLWLAHPARRTALAAVLLGALASVLTSACGEGTGASPSEAPTEVPGQALDQASGEPSEEASAPDMVFEEPLAAAPVDVARHEIALIVVHTDPLLRSEQRLLDVLVERMQMRRLDAVQREATDEESAYARTFFEGEVPEQGLASGLPESLTGPSVVVFVRFAPQRELDRGQRATRGFGGALAFRRGDTEPYLELRLDDAANWRGPDEQLWPWLISIVRAERAS